MLYVNRMSDTIVKKNPLVVFCIPGRSFSGRFLTCWTNLISECMKLNISIMVSNQYSSMVHFARSKCLGGDVSKGADQKPFQGQVNYDFLVWIDSDIVFSPEQIFNLIESPHDVTCGLYMMEDMQHFAVVKKWDIEYFKKHSTFRFLTTKDVDLHKSISKLKYMEVSYAGMGFMCIKKGVIEKLKYPWFFRGVETIEVENGTTMVEMCSEDVAFCKNLQDVGVKVMLDTTIRVGHEKTIPL